MLATANGFEAPATPALSSIINPAIDRCTADPAGWVKGPVPAPEAAVAKVRRDLTYPSPSNRIESIRIWANPLES